MSMVDGWVLRVCSAAVGRPGPALDWVEPGRFCSAPRRPGLANWWWATFRSLGSCAGECFQTPHDVWKAVPRQVRSIDSRSPPLSGDLYIPGQRRVRPASGRAGSWPHAADLTKLPSHGPRRRPTPASVYTDHAAGAPSRHDTSRRRATGKAHRGRRPRHVTTIGIPARSTHSIADERMFAVGGSRYPVILVRPHSPTGGPPS
jgi:hypothetical protein